MFYADLHIHSRFSRATSPACTPEGLAYWAQLKGVEVCGTGDCTHPLWMAELREKLAEDPDASGLYTLKPSWLTPVNARVPETCRHPVRFMVTGEISSIYKRDGRVRKVHSLILLPSLECAEQLNRKLSSIGNIHSDGRPILGLDPRHLLEMILEIDPRGALVPAHIWTPWFSMLGAKSGFDSVEACFGDLTPHLFAVETGLSSDAPMNHRIRCLDGLALISNSDLHSPANLGRNANTFFCKPDYEEMLKALRTRDPELCGGTVDLFPEEGKYHLDGHRACKTCFEPDASLAMDNRCPVCGKELTIGVLHRVEELERKQTEKEFRSLHRLPFRYMIPLPELIAQNLGLATTSKKVQAAYLRLLQENGSELPLLLDTPIETLSTLGVIGQMIACTRQGAVTRKGGYDGEYGVIHVNVS